MRTQGRTSPEPLHDDSSPAPVLVTTVWIGVAVFGLVTFTIALLAAFPARLAANWANPNSSELQVSGTMWQGSAILATGDRLTWRVDPLASLGALSLVAHLSLDGPDTALIGRLTTRGDRARVSGIRGRAGWGLVDALAPGLTLHCDIGMRFDDVVADVAERGAAFSGRIETTAGSCTNIDTQNTFSVPAAHGDAVIEGETTRFGLVLASDPTTLLIEATSTTSGDVKATIFPAALNLASGTEASGTVVYEMRPRCSVIGQPDC